MYFGRGGGGGGGKGRSGKVTIFRGSFLRSVGTETGSSSIGEYGGSKGESSGLGGLSGSSDSLSLCFV